MRNHEFKKRSEAHQAAMEQAREHMDARGMAEDSPWRGVVEVEVACQAMPELEISLQQCYPTPQALMQ